MGGCHTGGYRSIEGIDKEFLHMVGKVRIGSYGKDVPETMFASNSETNTESIG